MPVIKFFGFSFFLILYILLGFPEEYLLGSITILLISYSLPKLFFPNRKQIFRSFEKYYFIFFAINILFSLLDSYVSFQKGTIEHPWIFGSDPESYYLMASNFANHQSFDIGLLRGLYIGYPLLLGIIFKAFGTFLLIGLIFNVLASGILFVLTLRLSSYFSVNDKNLQLTAIFMLISPHILSLGPILLKDTWIAMGMVGAALYIILLLGKFKIKYLIGLIICLVIIGSMRGMFLVIPLLLPFFIKPLKNFKIQISLVVLFYLVYLVSANLNPYLRDLNNVLNNNVEGNYSQNWTTGFTSILLGGYSNWPIYKKIIFLPVTLLVQFVQPYRFWDLHYDYPWRFLQRTMMGVWLLYFLPLFFKTIYNKQKALKSNKLLKRLFLWSIAGFIVPAFLYGGVIPRYGIPFIPFFFITVSVLITSKKVQHVSINY